MSLDNTSRIEPTKRGAPRWMWITLFSSLALNLLIVGIIGGAAWSWKHGTHRRRHGFGGPMAAYFQTLPDERRAEFRKSIRAHFGEMRPLWKSVRKARNMVSDSLKSEPFDRRKFEIAMEALRNAEYKARRSMTPVLSELAAKLTPAERRRFLEHHSRLHKWRRRHFDDPTIGLGKQDGNVKKPPQAP